MTCMFVNFHALTSIKMPNAKHVTLRKIILEVNICQNVRYFMDYKKTIYQLAKANSVYSMSTA